MHIHLVKSCEHLAEALGTYSDHQGETNGRVVGVAATNPVPEFEHVLCIDAELLYLFGVCGDRDKVFRYRLLASQRPDTPCASRVCIEQRLLGREGLGRNDKECLCRVEIAGVLHELVAVDIGDETQGQAAITIIFQRLVGHARAEVRPTDPDIHNIANAFPSVPLPRAAAHLVGEVGHLVQHRVNLGHHVLAINNNALVLWGAQGHVQHRPLLCHVDLLAPEHGLDALLQPRRLCQLQQQAHRLVGNAVLGIVKINANGFRREALSPPGVLGKERSEMKGLYLLIVFLERLPGRALCQRWYVYGHLCYLPFISKCV